MEFVEGAGADAAFCCCWDALANSPHSDPVLEWFVGFCAGLWAGDDVGVLAGGGAILTAPGGGGRTPDPLVFFALEDTSLPSFF